MKNTVEIKNDKVIKTFASRMDYVRESSIYEKLNGTTLAPKLLGSWDGVIEHEFVEGKCFADIMHEAMANPVNFLKCSNLFWDWYKQFREEIKLSLGDTDFSDFVFDGSNLYCIDFEDCKPSGIENDVANLAASVCLAENSYTLYGIEDAKIFVKSAWERLDLNSEKLYLALKDSLATLAKDKDIKVVPSVHEYLATFVCTSFVHSPSSRNELKEMVSSIRCSNQMWVAFASNASVKNTKLLRYIMSTSKDGLDAIYLTEAGKFVKYPLLLRREKANDVLQRGIDSGHKLEDVIVFGFDSQAMPVENLK